MNPSYNNSDGFGSGGMQAPIVSGTGDIVLSSSEKKSHKGFIVAFIIAILIVGGIFAMLFLTSKGSIVGVSDGAKLAFNKYANYLLYGKESDEALEGEYDENNIYKLDEMRNENEQTVLNYFRTADGLLASFESLIGNSVNEDLLKTVVDYRADFELVRLTFEKSFIDEKELIDEVLNNDLESVEVWIADKYSDLANSNYASVKQYAEAEIDYYQLYADYLERAKDANCLSVENGIVCVDNDEELELQIEEAFDKASDILWVATNNVIENCWTIEKTMNGKGEQ